jgi:DNA-binding CsgD family transcriptional regulator
VTPERLTEEGFGGAVRRRGTGPLSKREREVLELISEGLSGAEIATRLVLSPETVRTHIRNAMGKLGASTRSQAVALALHRREIGEDLPTPPRPETPRRAAQPNEEETGVLDEALGQVLDGLVGLWDVDAGSIFLAEEDGLTLRRVAHVADEDSRPEPPENLALGEGTLGRVALERRSQIVADASTPGGSGMIVAPMLGSTRLVGVIGMTTRPSRPIGRQELLLLQVFAGRIAQLIEAGGDHVPERLRTALDRFRVSWAAATRAV